MLLKQPVSKMFESGLVMTDRSIYRYWMHEKEPGHLVAEMIPNGDGIHYTIPDLPLLPGPSSGELTIPGEFRVTIFPAALSDVSQATGSNVDAVASGVISNTSPADPVVNSISFHTLCFAVFQRNPDGTIRMDPETRSPLYAVSPAGVPMIGPLMLTWQDNAVVVKNATGIDSSDPESDPGDLIVDGGSDTVMAGGWVAGGGTDCCSNRQPTFGLRAS